MQVSFPVDSRLKCTGVSVNCLAQWRTYYMPITMKYKTRMIHLAQPSAAARAEHYYWWEECDLRRAPVAYKFRECSVLASKPLRVHLLFRPSDMLSNNLAPQLLISENLSRGTLTHTPIKELQSPSVVIKCKTPLKRDCLCFPAKGARDKRRCLLNIILKHCVK